MPEPRRLDAAGGAADRDGRIEALLVEGLDAYFAGRYAEAIHVWTRVLFLDRSHARARAYIDRARTAMAERHRVGDELLQSTEALLDQGRTDAARALFTQAVDAGGEDERVAALRLRFERIERVERLARPHAPSGPPERAPAPAAAVLPGWHWRRRPIGVILAGAGFLLAAGVIGLLGTDWLRADVPARPDRLADRPADRPWPVPSTAEVALIRARTLVDRGRLAEALQTLDRVGADSAARVDADALRIRIQDLLLAGGPARFRSRGER
jgi:tetratricopeptide (TPR) repeat protein